MPKGGLGSAKEDLIKKTTPHSIVGLIFSQMIREWDCNSQTNFVEVLTKWKMATGRDVEESAGRLKAIHIHYRISSATITSSPRHFQVDSNPLRLYWSCQPSFHGVTQTCSSSLHFSNTFDHCKLNEYNKPVNMKCIPHIQFKMWLHRNNSRSGVHSHWSQVFP